MGILRYRISPKGYPYLLVMLVIAAAIYHFDAGQLLLGVSLVLALVVCYIFRDSTRAIPASPLGVIAPIDGEVTAIESCEIEKLECTALKVKIRGNLLGSYVVRGPTEGKVNRFWVDGKTQFFCIETDEGDKVALGLGIGHAWNRPRLRTGVGERIGQGKRFGYVPAAADVTVAIGGASQINVDVGAKVRAGETIIASIRH